MELAQRKCPDCGKSNPVAAVRCVYCRGAMTGLESRAGEIQQPVAAAETPGPVEPQVGGAGTEQTWKPIAAGKLCISAGVINVLGGLVVVARAGLFERDLLEPGAMSWLGVLGVLLIITGIISIVGGAYALKRRKWALALAGAICATMTGNLLLGAPAIVFLSLSMREFNGVSNVRISDTIEIGLEMPVAPAISRGAWVAPLAYLAAIATAELITALVNPLGGVVFHIVLLLGLMLHASLAVENPSHKLYLALALAPLIRLLSLSMPVVEFAQIYWYGIVAVPLLMATFMVMRRLDYGRHDVGLTLNRLPFQLLIGLTGIPLGIVMFYILRPAPLIDTLTLEAVLLPALILLVGTGFAEELVFRGLMQRSAQESLGRWGWIYVAVLSAILHTGYLLVSNVLFVLVVGLFFGWVVIKTRSLLGVALAHGMINTILFLIAPFLL